MARVTGSKEIEDLLKRYSLELDSLEDAYTTSRCVARDYTADEIARVKGVVDEVMNIARRFVVEKARRRF
ncbi:MAG: hypothetical protein QW348_06725 [Ignisphaera sp.]